MKSEIVGVPPDEEAVPAPYAARWMVLAVVLVAEVMDLLDATVTSVAAPSVRADIGGGETTLQWLGAAYTLPFAVLLITAGRLGDLWGRRRLFLIGAAGFTVASVACAAATSPGMLLTTRALQGALGALLIPQGFGLLKEVFPAKELGKAFGLFGPVMGLSAVGGPIIGGALVDGDLFGTGWRMIFLINLPLGILAIIGALRYMPKGAWLPGVKLDIGGMVLVSLSSVAVVYPLVQGRELDWPLWTFGLLALGVAGFVLFVVHQRRHRGQPLVEPSLLSNRAYRGGILVALTFFAAFTGLLLVLSLFFQAGLGFSPMRAGLTLAPLALGVAATSPLSTSLAPRFGRTVIQAGVAATAAGLGVLAAIVSAVGDDATSWKLAPGIFLVGLGMGFVFAPLFDVILAGVSDQEVGSASGVLNAVQQLANAVGVAVVATFFFSFTDHGYSPSEAMTRTAVATVGLLLLAFLSGFALPRTARTEGH
ncbi:MFS transporter [Streptomyces sp. NPDC050560]|uniref:MFS transporter n=1 Tax=Streptomyces sp. NPDC050560 TaxID=3365630 RepID=UPI0037A823F5